MNLEQRKSIQSSVVEDKSFDREERAGEMAQFVKKFETCSLPRAKWNHEAHLTVALWYLYHYAKPIATALIREGIQKYNLVHGIVITDTSGYHETITLFHIWAIDRFLATADRTRSLAELVDQLIEQYGNNRLLFEHYSGDCLNSWEARIRWVEPDLKPLDQCSFWGGNNE